MFATYKMCYHGAHLSLYAIKKTYIAVPSRLDRHVKGALSKLGVACAGLSLRTHVDAPFRLLRRSADPASADEWYAATIRH